MNDLAVTLYNSDDERDEEDDLTPERAASWELKILKPRHKRIASLICQGLKYVEIASVMKITPEYVSMLSRQPLIKAFIAELSEAAGIRLEALTGKTVQVITEVLDTGSNADKLKAARLQMEATNRLGTRGAAMISQTDAADRIERLAHRLIDLQSTQPRKGVTYNERGQEVTDV